MRIQYFLLCATFVVSCCDGDEIKKDFSLYSLIENCCVLSLRIRHDSELNAEKNLRY